MVQIRRLTGNTYLLTIISKVLLLLFGIVNSIVSSRYLGANLKGQYNYMLTFIAMLSVFLNMGVYQSYTIFKKQKLHGLKEKYLRFFKVQFAANVIVAIGLMVFGGFDNRYLLVILPLQVMNNQMNFLCMIEDINVKNLTKVVSMSFYSFSVLMLFVFAVPPNLLLIGIIAFAQQTIGILMKIKLIDLKIFSPGQKTDWHLLGRAIRVGFLPMLTILLITSNYKIDIFFIRSMTGYAEVGIYSLAVNLAAQVWLIPDAFKDVLFGKNARKNDTAAINQAIRFNLVFSGLIVVGFMGLGYWFIHLLYGEPFLGAYMPLLLILVGNIFMIYYKFIYTLFISDGQRIISVYIFVISAFVNIILNLMLIPMFGINGAALASLVSYSICGISFLSIYIRRYNIPLRETFMSRRDIINYRKKLVEIINRKG